MNQLFILPAQLSVNPDTIAVSGFSSGGCFATQFHAAFSGTVGPTFSGSRTDLKVGWVGEPD